MFDATEVAAALSRAASLGEHPSAGGQLMNDVRTIELARRHLDGAELALLGTLDAFGTTDIATGHRTPNWLARVAELSPAGAGARVRLARTLRAELPGTALAVREGRLSEDRAKLMARATNERIAARFCEMEEALIEASRTMTYAAFTTHLELVVYLLDPDGPPPPHDDITNNRLTVTKDSGELKMSGVFVGDHAAIVEAAIEQMTDQLWRKYKTDHDATNGEIDIPPRNTLRALAVAELMRRGLMVDENGGGTKPRVEATLVITADAFGIVYLNGSPLVRNSSTALACDVDVMTIILDSLGLPLDMGREIRTANKEQRKALKVRDGGCVFPGCGMRPDHCDAHHVAEWWRDLGTTDVKFMVYLCRHHHCVIHRRGWSLSIGDDGWSWITMPSGISMWCQRHGDVRAGPLPNTG